MSTLGSNWKKWFYNKFPLYVRNNDTYIDNSGKGLFERFMGIFGEYIEDLEGDWENFLQKTRDLDECDDSLLPEIAWELGSPPNPLGDNIGLRRLLHYVVTLYKIKGTLECLQIILEILGYEVDIYVDYPDNSHWDFKDEGNTMDNPLIWDDFNWDDYCHTCVPYRILIWSSLDDQEEGDYNDINIEDLEGLLEIISWVEPIDASLDSITHNIGYCEEAILDLEEEAILECFEFEYYDLAEWDDFNWDDSESCGTENYQDGLGAFNNDFSTNFNT